MRKPDRLTLQLIQPTGNRKGFLSSPRFEDDRQLSTRAIERAMRKARNEAKGLPAGFRYHDLRALLRQPVIASGAAVKTALDTYGHIWPTVTSGPGPP